MKKLFCIFVSFICFCSIGRSEVYVYTNVITSLSPSAHPLTFDKNFIGRYTLYVRTGSGIADITNHTFAWEIRRKLDDVVDGIFPVDKISESEGIIRASASFTGFEPGSYQGKIIRYLNETNVDGIVANDFITIYEGCDQCSTGGGGSSSVSVTVTSISSGVDSDFEISSDGALRPVGTDRDVEPRSDNTSDLGGETNQYRKIHGRELLVDNTSLPPIPRPTSSTAQILQWSGTGGGSNIFWGNVYGPTPAQGFGTNRVFFTNVLTRGTPGPSYTWTVPAGVSNVVWYLWGAGGTSGQYQGGGGGFVYALMPVVPGAQYDIWIGQGGALYSSSVTNSSYGCRSKISAFSGHAGGATAVFEAGTTNLILIAGGGGGGGYQTHGGAGGGLGGGDGARGGASNLIYGAGSISATNILNPPYRAEIGNTNAYGSYLFGGQASIGTNTAPTGYLGPGGAGYYGGNGASVTGNTHQTMDAGGGGGSAWASSNHVTYASTVRAAQYYITPAQELPTYVAGRGMGVSNTGAAGDGLGAVEY